LGYTGILAFACCILLFIHFLPVSAGLSGFSSSQTEYIPINGGMCPFAADHTFREQLMDNPKYEPVLPVTRSELTSQLESGDAETVAKALYAASRYEQDWEWVQDQCLKRLESPEASVRWAAVTCLGDLVFFRRPLDIQAVLPSLEKATKDPEIADPASLSLSMVKQFLGSK
jgi:hypothetical protein